MTGTRTAIENKDKLQNILGQRVIVTKYYANIVQARTCNKGLYKTMCGLLNRHNNMKQRYLGKSMENKDYLLVYSLGYPNAKQ